MACATVTLPPVNLPTTYLESIATWYSPKSAPFSTHRTLPDTRNPTVGPETFRGETEVTSFNTRRTSTSRAVLEEYEAALNHICRIEAPAPTGDVLGCVSSTRKSRPTDLELNLPL